MSASGNGPLPFPRTIYPFGEPQLPGTAFLNGKAGDVIREKGQKAHVLHKLDQIFGRADVAPMAAMALSPRLYPATMVSTMLYTC